jgi:hypothetical protein
MQRVCPPDMGWIASAGRVCERALTQQMGEGSVRDVLHLRMQQALR